MHLTPKDLYAIEAALVIALRSYELCAVREAAARRALAKVVAEIKRGAPGGPTRHVPRV